MSIVLTSIAIVCAYGIGLLFRIVFRDSLDFPPLALILLGLFFNQALVLAGCSLSVALWSCLVLSLIGYFICFSSGFSVFPRWSRKERGEFSLIFLCFLWAILGVVFEPIADWDARSIWFFHAKIIYYSGGFSAADWNPAKIVYGLNSHLDYPKFIPILGAQFASLVGFWNEYIPKGSLLVLTVLLVGGLQGLRISLTYRLLMAAFISVYLQRYLYNGYMDGYLGAISAIGLLYFVQYFRSGLRFDYLQGVLFLALSVQIKNEGLAFSAIALAGFWLCYLFGPVRAGRLFRLKDTALSLVGFLPLIIWVYRKHLWGIGNDLVPGIFNKPIIDNLSSLALWRSIVEVSITLMPIPLLLFISGLVVAFTIMLRCSNTALGWAFLSVAAYCALLLVIYAGTPHDLMWHLKTSLERTLFLPTTAFWLLVLYFRASYPCSKS